MYTITQETQGEQWRCPTALGAFLLRLYVAECNATHIDAEDLSLWWIEKWRDPNPVEEDFWQSEQLWGRGARHLHLLLKTNAPSVAIVMAPFLGISEALEPKRELADDASEQMQNLSAETYFSSDEPPYLLSRWLKPLRFRRKDAVARPVSRVTVATVTGGVDELRATI